LLQSVAPRPVNELLTARHFTLALGWVLGYGHHFGPEAVEISNRNNKNRKEAELGKRKRAHKKSNKFEEEVKRVRTESPPEEWKTPEDCSLEKSKVVVNWFHQPRDKISIMKKGELWARWVETKERSEYDCTCLAPGDEITTRGTEPIEAGQKASMKRCCKPTKNATTEAKKEHPNDDASPYVARDHPKGSTLKQGRKTPVSNSTDDESSSCSSSQSDFSGNDESSNAIGINDDSMFLLMGADSDSKEERKISEWNARKKTKNNKEKRKALLKHHY
jgi:hypothetical protein